jgi:hypothetical protein
MKKTTMNEMNYDNLSQKEDESLYKDDFGFRKLILTVTKVHFVSLFLFLFF